MADEKDLFWYNYDLSNEKQYIKAVKHIQKLVRGSMSYDVWQKRSKIGIQECPICGESKEYVKLESHHYPKTLFDVIDEKIQMHIDFNTLDEKTDFDICQEIMDDHFQHKVEYVVLCEHCHKKYHDNHPEIIDETERVYQKQKLEREKYFKKQRSENESKQSDKSSKSEYEN